jgi:predicted DNA-binding transcriptional regulator AlpA
MDDIIERLERIEAAVASPPREYLNIEQAAAFIGVSRQTIDLWRSEATGPDFHRVGRRVLYAVADLRAFMERHKQKSLA